MKTNRKLTPKTASVELEKSMAKDALKTNLAKRPERDELIQRSLPHKPQSVSFSPAAKFVIS